MYNEYFQFNDSPFRLTPDPSYLFLSKVHSRAKAYMDYSLWNRDSFVVITGEIGSGKTTLIESLLSSINEDILVAKVYQTQLDEEEFLQAVLVEFGFEPFKANKVELLHTLNKFLTEQYENDKRVLLIVDEAQNLSPRVLEEIRMLSGLETHKEKILNVLLVGQPELGEILDSPGLEQLVQRIRLRFHIQALTEEETKLYIQHRLQIAGSSDLDLFDDETVGLVYHYTGGVPRLVNVLCDTVLTAVFANEEKTIVSEVVHAAAEELQWSSYDERLAAQASVPVFAVNDSPACVSKFIISYQGESVGEYVLNKQSIMLGRAANNDIRLEDLRVSSGHAQVTNSSQGCFLVDLGSKNGTYVNGRAIDKYKLKDGDVISISSKYRLQYVVLGTEDSNIDDTKEHGAVDSTLFSETDNPNDTIDN